MAVLVTNLRLPTFAQAWAAFCSGPYTTSPFVANPATLVGSWTNGSSPNGGFFQLAWTDNISAQQRQFNFFAGDTAGVTNAGLSVVGRAPVAPAGFFAGGSVHGATSPTQLATQFAAAWTQAAVALCSAAGWAYTIHSITLSGGSGEAVAIAFMSASTANDAVTMLANAYINGFFNPNYLTNVAVNTMPGSPNPNIQLSVAAPASIGVPDIEIAINNGSAIYSASTTTFTEP